jgi:hypothetical protein
MDTCTFNRNVASLTIAACMAVFAAGITVVAQDEVANRMTFFITSDGPGNGADLGGLAGADAYCQTLAEPVGGGDLTWRAYLSMAGESGVVDARDRIGPGPWHNAEGVLIAESVEHLHSDDNNLTKETGLTEGGGIVNGRGDNPNRHDILTGSQLDGTAFNGAEDLTCEGWTSSNEGSAQLGHHDRTGGAADPTSWNSAHSSRGCSQSDLVSTGGDGLFYCFAIDQTTAVKGHSWGTTKAAANR